LPKTYVFRDAINNDLSRQRLLGSVSGGFAILALALLATGLYGILSRTVNEQRRDIGICMALGARRERVVAELARSAAERIAIGLGAGAILAAFAAWLLRSQLFGVSFQSPAIVLATLGVLTLVLIVAFVVPAGRAASIDPMQALRTE
jgi:ABC-type antimicrobial peptide transport system permease subunit